MKLLINGYGLFIKIGSGSGSFLVTARVGAGIALSPEDGERARRPTLPEQRR
jgi:hypothetical protein